MLPVETEVESNDDSGDSDAENSDAENSGDEQTEEQQEDTENDSVENQHIIIADTTPQPTPQPTPNPTPEPTAAPTPIQHQSLLRLLKLHNPDQNQHQSQRLLRPNLS